MITKQIKAKILERFNDKQEKIFISNILDKAYRFEKENKLIFTNFLNLNETLVVTKILNEIDVKYYVYAVNEYTNKKVIFFIPDYILYNNNFFDEYICCLSIIPNVKGKLKHKDYMGAIYSLGLKNEMVGDIFVSNDIAYVFCMKSVSNYICDNLYKVGNQEVKITKLSLLDSSVKKLQIKFIAKEYIVASLRVDTIVSAVFNLSRGETKEKIVKGDLFINDKNIFYPNTLLNKDDVVSFKKCGKIKIGEAIRKTKNNNIVLNIEKFC